MLTDTIVAPSDVKAFMLGCDIPDLSIRLSGSQISASCTWPHGDVVRGKFCHGQSVDLAEAIAQLRAELDKAKLAAKKLKTAAECKEAVLDLIREHDAAPASFRDAVDQLQVQ
ncbi:hypothetical protein ABC347_07935 [Sphingomonas sp. 1P06PA]|uniref:hypothetical protein n=1 Tax=Sphingomonas sp. 1P06PA TaxID=554121 RepID=UPI0039A44A45